MNTEEIVHMLTSETWSKTRRNTVARLVALSRGSEDTEVVRHRYRIVTNGVVGRYDANRAELLRIIAEANGCATRIHTENYEYQGKRRRYAVLMFGHRTDIDRSITIYSELMTNAVAHLLNVTGENVARRRRDYLNAYINMIAARVQDVGEAPNVKEWIARHHEESYAAAEAAGATDYHLERSS